MNDNFQNTKNAIITYFKGVRTEWGKITWPERQQVIVETFFVVAIVFVFTLTIYGADKIIEWILSFFNRV
ncbi:MAG: preprotein translocase subunit SecE [Cyanobacteria bacterium SIG28]|nr:preprotein translocase subunit SecE [Cyanobacteria bacterium SIG28]